MMPDFLEFAKEKLYVGIILCVNEGAGMPARRLKTGRFLGLCYGIVLVWGSNSVVRMPHLQCGSRELESLLLHQPTDRRNLLKEETNFRHGLSTQIGHPR